MHGIHLVYEEGVVILKVKRVTSRTLLLKKVKPAQIVNLLPSLHAQCIKRDTANYLSETCQIFSSLEKGEASS
ncbi:unnamed protein product [Brassica oleracea var. botrytis]|uniref:Uncharacterized protein n=1 Tax=Brassica oleracea TaxID=3712 RepID=A0A3P6GCA7_BRAOL|nr:unnamed protein product [Brassica oleracea]